jgi:hypothetical protein
MGYITATKGHLFIAPDISTKLEQLKRTNKNKYNSNNTQ